MAEKLERRGQIRFVPLAKTRTREEVSQRKLDPKWVAQLAQTFDPDQLGYPVVNRSGEWYWILDGQHRIAALKDYLGDDWKTQQVECVVHDGLSEREEAILFDRLNTTKAVSVYDKFRVRLTAGLPEETNVDAIVRLNKLKISRQRETGAVSCVSTMLKVYRRSPDVLNRTLHVVYHSFSDAGLDADVIDGVGALIGRYDGQIDDQKMIDALKELHGGVTTYRQRGERIRQQMGGTKSHALAAAAVEAYNKGRGKKLPKWWAADDVEDAR